jgi:hypothetical protein
MGRGGDGVCKIGARDTAREVVVRDTARMYLRSAGRAFMILGLLGWASF